MKPADRWAFRDAVSADRASGIDGIVLSYARLPFSAVSTYALVQTASDIRPYHLSSAFDLRDRVSASQATDLSLAFVFPGQGSQSVGMLAALSERYPSVRETFDEASNGAGIDLWALSQGGPEEQLNRTEFTQPALLAASIGVWRLWRSQGGRMPSMLAGHSLGEYSALVAADALSLRDAAHLVRIRGQLMQDAAPAGSGAMAAVIGVDDDVVRDVCAEVSASEVVVAANFNSPGQVVIGGHTAAVERASLLLGERGARKVARLAVSVPSHTPLMRDAANRLAEAMHGLDWREPTLPVVQNADAEVHTGVAAIRDALVRQLYLPVQWTTCVQALAARGIVRMAECGPGKVLGGLIKRIDHSIEHRALATPGDFEATLEAWR
jgi:[acyl-carrier-protein] S-malonyltransferase